MKKVMFSEQTGEYYGDYGNGMTPISQSDCYRYINSTGVKCYGIENGYVVYAK